MLTERTPPTVQDGRAIAGQLVRMHPSIEGVILCGSVARGDADEWSDVDLVVVGSDPEITAQHLRTALADHDGRLSLIYYTASILRNLRRERALFVSHLQREGIVLYDKNGSLKEVLGHSFTPNVNIHEEIATQLAKLAPYSDPRRFNNNFLFCLSHLYSIGKGIVMLGLAKDGVYEFNREAAFRRFVHLNPDLAQEAGTVARLRPFYRLVTERRPEPLPFPYQSAGRQVTEAVHAIEALAERAERQ